MTEKKRLLPFCYEIGIYWETAVGEKEKPVPPVLCIIGPSGSGKTTLMERLIRELTGRGYRIGAAKHCPHGFEFDPEGKDSRKHAEAGASAVAVVSPERFALLRRSDEEFDSAEPPERLFRNEDLLLAEGFKGSRHPKIRVLRAESGTEAPCEDNDRCIAVVTESSLSTDLPVFRPDESVRIADFIEARYLANRRKPRIVVHLDGKPLPMKDFVKDFVFGGIRGMLSSLRGWKSPKSVDIHLHMEED